jgi:hypothetical protein
MPLSMSYIAFLNEMWNCRWGVGEKGRKGEREFLIIRKNENLILDLI